MAARSGAAASTCTSSMPPTRRRDDRPPGRRRGPRPSPSRGGSVRRRGASAGPSAISGDTARSHAPPRPRPRCSCSRCSPRARPPRAIEPTPPAATAAAARRRRRPRARPRHRPRARRRAPPRHPPRPPRRPRRRRPAPTASPEPKPYAINLASAADFVPQYTFEWCVGASIMMARSIITDSRNESQVVAAAAVGAGPRPDDRQPVRRREPGRLGGGAQRAGPRTATGWSACRRSTRPWIGRRSRSPRRSGRSGS